MEKKLLTVFLASLIVLIVSAFIMIKEDNDLGVYAFIVSFISIIVCYISGFMFFTILIIKTTLNKFYFGSLIALVLTIWFFGSGNSLGRYDMAVALILLMILIPSFVLVNFISGCMLLLDTEFRHTIAKAVPVGLLTILEGICIIFVVYPKL